MSDDTLKGSISMAAANAEARKQETPGEAEAKASVDVAYVTCPCCGKLTLVRPVEVKGEILDHYMACIMTGTSFWHTYKIYGDKIAATVTQLDRDLSQKLTLLSSDVDTISAYVPEETGMKCKHIWNMCGLYIHIKGISINAGLESRTFTPQDAAIKACDMLRPLNMGRVAKEISDEDIVAKIDAAYALLSDPSVVSAVPNRMLIALVESHNRLYDLLMSAGFDANFWDGIELA